MSQDQYGFKCSESTYGGGSTLGTWRIRQAGLAGSASTEREMATNVGEGRKYLAEGGQGSARGRIQQDSMLVKCAHL